MAFWNVAGVKGKEKDFWERIKKWDVVGLVEKDWVEEKDWERFKGRVPEEFDWEIQGARRESKKGRTAGGSG